MREIIVARFPCCYNHYVEVFGGAGWVFFHKPIDQIEVFNDYNSLIANLYRCVRKKPSELIEALRYVLNSREDFLLSQEALKQAETLPEVERAALFYQVIRHSYASGLKSFAGQPHDIWRDFVPIQQAHRRVSHAVIENRDFQKLIQDKDSEKTFFYCDPPYFQTESFYQNVGKDGFTVEDHYRLRDTLMSIKGKFLLSYGDHPFIRELYDFPSIQIEHHTRLHNMQQRTNPGAMFHELLIANYDMSQRARNISIQMQLFEG